MLSVALVEPEIPQNTGNIARLCAVAQTPLYIVGVTGFRMDDRAVRRAGLDYWSEVSITRHRDLDELQASQPQARTIANWVRPEDEGEGCQDQAAGQKQIFVASQKGERCREL